MTGANLLSSALRRPRYSNILLMGPPGCGKTTVGKILASRAKKQWIDIDDDILEPAWAMSVADKLAKVGDEHFLDQEEKVVKQMNVSECIVSLSGSIPLRCAALQNLSKDGLIIYLDSPLQSIVNRLHQMKVNRIVGHAGRPLANVLKERLEVYENSYDIRIPIHDKDKPDEIADKVMNAIECYNKEYQSTRGLKENHSFHSTLTTGLAQDGGLFLPKQWGSFHNQEELLQLVPLGYAELCVRVMEKFPCIPSWRLREICNEGYSSFSHPDILPLTPLKEGQWTLEAFHGPTASFKDLSLQLLPKLFVESKKESQGEENPALLVATSGDTGSAALDGFSRVNGIPVVVMFPNQGVSSVQKAQMVRAPKNVCVIGVESDFDWCQQTVKTLLRDHSSLPSSYSWTSANSMNFGRLLPQVCFTVFSYLSLVRSKEINMGDPMDVTVPTGNFGFIFAASVAKRMGIPIRNLVCASNENNVLSEFIRTGRYDLRQRKFHTTVSPAIDILVSSNLERWLYMLLRDHPLLSHEEAAAQVTSMMDSLAKNKFFTVPDHVLKNIQSTMAAGWCSEQECMKTVRDTFFQHGRLIDPHTAVAVHVADKYQTNGIPMVVASTAHWAKFPEVIIESLSSHNPMPCGVVQHSAPLEEQYNILQKLVPNEVIPETLSKLVLEEPLHTLTSGADLGGIIRIIQDYTKE